MTQKIFGTDGIRGTANSYPMTAEIAVKVGMAAGLHFISGAHRHRVVIGKDTRLSGYMIEPALTAGFVAAGIDPILVGPLPTPAVAMLTRSLRADLGVMISASHNPYEDNGIKLFGPDGYKLSDAVETQIEQRVVQDMTPYLAETDRLGRALRLEDAQGRYIEFAKQTLPKGQTLDGLKVVIDCANGAAYKVAPTILWELGAEVIPVGVEPDGTNINKACGSTDASFLSAQVAIHGADLGIALDGDADRLLIADQNGQVVDGDQIMGSIAAHWKADGRLRGNCLVATVMSNKGLELHLKGLGIDLHRTRVGDRYVVERMREGDCNLGGEQSGHIVMSDYATTGDGLLAALQVLAMVCGAARPASEICRPFKPLPQLLKNVRINSGDPMTVMAVQAAIGAGEQKLGGKGRVLIRKSGTESLIRVMAEGEDPAIVELVVNDIVTEIERSITD